MSGLLTLALPAYNESDSLDSVIEEAQCALESMGRDYEVLVIDNMSTDATREVVRKRAEQDPRVRLIAHEQNRLYSGSCETALRSARGDVLVIMDSDGQMDPLDIPRLVRRLDVGLNVVFGARTNRHDPIFRLVSSRLFNLMGRYYLDFPFDDLNCGIRALDRRAIDSISLTHRINMANPEIYVQSARQGLQIGQEYVKHRARHAGRTSHNFKKSWALFRSVRSHLRDLARTRATDG